MSETLIDSQTDIRINLNVNNKPKHYRLKVNINGFRLEDIRVSLSDSNKENDKVQVKISAFRNIKTNNQDTTKEYIKYFDIFKSKSNISSNTMRYYLDQMNPLYLVIEFVSNSDENVYINLDDSCESLVEMAAKSLLNIKNIEDLRGTIENPNTVPLNPELDGLFSPSLIRDLNLATKTTFTPIKVIQDKNGVKRVRVEASMPSTIKTVSLVESKDEENVEQQSNHARIRLDGLKLHLNATTLSENTTSTYTKQFCLPKGTDTSKIVYRIDENKHLLLIEAPYLD